MKKSTIFSVILAGVFALLCGWFLVMNSGKAPVVSVAYTKESLATFAQCLTDKGVTLYGASWCSHCQRQKAEFGEAIRLIKYVECGAGPRQSDGATQICIQKNTLSYPTWIFKDETRAEGETSFSILAYKTGCPMPQLLNTSAGLTGSTLQR